MEGEALGHGELRVHDAVDHLLRDAGEDVAGGTHWREGELTGAHDLFRTLAEVRECCCRRRPASLEDGLELLLEVTQSLLRLFDGDVTAPDERLGVVLAHRSLGVDELVHQRLGQ